MPPLAGLQVAKMNAPHLNTDQTDHLVPDGRQHPAHLPVAAFVEPHLHDARPRLRTAPGPPRPGGRGADAVVED